VVVHGFSQKHTVGHVFENCLLARNILETNAETNFLSKLDIHLVGDTLRNGHGSHTTRLRTRHELVAEMWEVVEKHKLRNLSRFTGTSLSYKNKDLRLVEHIEKLLPLLMDGEVAASFQDVEVLARERLTVERVGWAIFGLVGLRSSRLVPGESRQNGSIAVSILPLAVGVSPLIVLVHVGEVWVFLRVEIDLRSLCARHSFTLWTTVSHWEVGVYGGIRARTLFKNSGSAQG
jgi:hypothetical protein